jgi:hypothetical protein
MRLEIGLTGTAGGSTRRVGHPEKNPATRAQQ